MATTRNHALDVSRHQIFWPDAGVVANQPIQRRAHAGNALGQQAKGGNDIALGPLLRHLVFRKPCHLRHLA
jgi:hypothetical protein